MSTVHSSFGGAIRLLTVSGLALACSFHPAFAAVLITISANTTNEVFTISGTGCAPGGYTTPQTLQWAPGTSCTVAFVSPYSQQAGTQNVLTGWQDGSTSNPRVIVTPAQSATYTASFETQYQLIGVANPPAGGTVSGAGWVDAGGIATLTATAAAGYRFVNWSGNSIATPSANPISVQMSYAQTIAANFEPVTNAVQGDWSAMQIATNSIGYGINSYGEVAGNSGGYPFLWVPIAANSVAGTLTNLSTSTTLPAATAVNDFGQVLFVQATCCNEYAPASLWTPAVAQGTVGTTTTISTGYGGGGADTLNNFGQVGAYVNGSPGIWTPVAANGTTGAFTPNAQLQYLVAMNGFGQAVLNSNSATTLLFTPLTANGTVGTFTSIVGLAGATENVPVAINAGGAVLGYSCVAQSSGSCEDQGFVWTPASSNGISGTTVAMPMPPGFVTVTPTAINSTGSVAGTMAPSSGSAIPFLYIGGTYYDLTTISGVPAGAVPAGINQAGQILLNTPSGNDIVYLATPIPLPAAPPAGAVLITIAANTTNEVFTVSGTGCAPGGYTTPQTLQWAPGTSCTVAFVSPYSQQAGTQNVLTGWQDGSTSNPRVIVTPAQSATYTASFETQYQLIGVANPPAGGTVSGAGWVDAGGIATLTATAAAGYRFVNWSGNSIATPSANPISVQMSYAQTIAANFEPVTNAVQGDWSAMQIATNSIGYGINSYGEVAGNSGGYPFLWVPIAANSVAGTLTNLSTSTTLPAATAVNDFGQVLFVQATCCNEYAPASLWTPAVAQGTVGTTTTISTGYGGGGADTLNNFGQVGAYVNGSPGIWTPVAANGTTGAFTPNAQLQYLVAMNGFGQAVLNSNSATTLLFTPLTANGTVGTFTSIVGLAGATENVPVAINAGGAVLGYSCVAQSSGSCEDQGFVWTPASSNGISGTTVAMPMPPGFVTVTPTAINSTGSVAGTMAPSSGSAIPFLYIGGTYYDLTTISGVPAGAVPAGINQAGQILLNTPSGNDIVYLATPIPLPAAPPAGAVLITIAANTTNEVFTVSGTGCAPGGYTTPQTLQWAPGTSCTVAFVSPYSQQAGTQNVLTGWQDGSTSNPRVIVTPAQSATYTASFETQYQLIGVANPPAGGTVSGAGWVDAGGIATLTATAAAGYRFVNWSGNSIATPSANPISVQMSYAQTIAANFEPVTNAVQGDWSAMQIATNSIGYGINSYGEVAGNSGGYPFLWVPIAANSVAGTLTNLSTSTTLPAATAVNDFGQVLFVQATCCNEYAPASLWTPAVAQGTVGTTTTISTGYGGGGADTLNNFGQVGAYVNGSPGIWTPVAANGTTGAFTPNAQLQYLVAMNGFGQAVLNSNSATTLLFTPLTANGTVGTFTSIVGLAGATENVPVAINAGGAVLGYSCVAQSSGSCEDQGFVWTPASSNGISGTTVAMPMPPGFVTVTPTAINSTGSVAGTMAPPSGSAIPFLYIGGTYYDLTTISGVPAGAVPAGINQAGQILLNTPSGNNIVYLATPPLIISRPASLLAGFINYPYPATDLAATGGSGIYTWSATGLPAGLNIGTTTGIISGTPLTNSGSPYAVQVNVTDSNSTAAARSYTLTIGAVNPCDLKQTGSITVVDVQLIINEALGITPAVYDLSGTGVANVVDVQIEINAALGLGCSGQ